MGVSGGAVFPPIQGAIADSAGTRISYIVPLVGFTYVLGYTTFHWIRHGRHIIRVKDSVISADGVIGGTVDTIDYNGEKVMKVEEAELSYST